jgi:hypothetical protein
VSEGLHVGRTTTLAEASGFHSSHSVLFDSPHFPATIYADAQGYRDRCPDYYRNSMRVGLIVFSGK